MRFLPVENLIPGMKLGQGIVGLQSARNYEKGLILTAEDISFFDEKGIFGIYVMEETPVEILSKELFEACLHAVKNIDIDAIIELAPKMAKELINNGASLDFRSVRPVDDYVAHHSVCVAIYTVAIGMAMDMDESFLCDMALAGLLHDIGKSLLGLTPLEKKETLTQDEFKQIKKHPSAANEFLSNDDRILPLVGAGILFHHENVNGTGYPHGLIGEEIPLLAKILHVADVYDAMLSKKVYKRGMSSADALNYLIGGKSILFDEQIVDVFSRIVVAYPTGIEVKLSTGESGVVLGQTRDNMRPIVSLPHYHIADLYRDMKYRDVHIVGDLAYLDHTDTEGKGPVEEESTTSNVAPESVTRDKIMIVDDVYMSIAHTKRALGETYDIIYCKDGMDALRMIRGEMPDLILMDYEMPDMDGVSTAMELHKIGFNMPIIFLTGKGDKETVCECIKCGAVDYILKPANPVYLKSRVEKALKAAKGQAIME